MYEIDTKLGAGFKQASGIRGANRAFSFASKAHSGLGLDTICKRTVASIAKVMEQVQEEQGSLAEILDGLMNELSRKKRGDCV